MKISTVREFRDKATALLRAKDPILVTRRGRLAGVFFPWPESTMPIELKREMFSILNERLRKHLSKQGVSEVDVAADFESWRQSKRETGRRR